MAQLEQTAILPDSGDADPAETAEWLASLRYILDAEGPERARWLVSMLNEVLARKGLATHGPLNTPYINTIPPDRQPPYPGNRWIEHRIESILRWNAMAMVSRANHEHHGIGGHISTYASTATLFEVGLNHFFRGKGDGYSGDLVYFQGHASPGVYARAFLEGRLTERQMTNFRQELAPEGGLSSYPHPWLMPDFWEFSTVSMGLGPIMAIYQARFNRYLTDRGILD
ncbi:MAG TPA: pyruvate dehydrogenase (acetyl-transferring), homodimeric type, partial [Pirellulales bacterium]|nr:pyruvate dehydrogenase (acetyl-transferring), homodimeric type [Pirellulales bacterium]